MKMASADFQIKFDGEQHEIDVNTLTSSLLGFGSVLQDINKKMSPESSVKINVKATKEGSFFVTMSLHYPELMVAMKNLFTLENIAFGTVLIGALADILGIKEHLKGKKAKSSESVSETDISITNEENVTLTFNETIYNIYISTPSIDRTLTKSFETIESDENISALRISTTEGEDLRRVPRESFSAMTSDNEDIQEDRRTIERHNVAVQATKIVWDPGAKWQFIFEGNKISATISDPTFYQAIKEGQRHAQGDVYEVDMQIIQIFVPQYQGYLNKTYEITRVINHIPRPEQLGLDL